MMQIWVEAFYRTQYSDSRKSFTPKNLSASPQKQKQSKNKKLAAGSVTLQKQKR